MSSLEIKGRNAYAVNVLNKLRHKLLGRQIDFEDKDAKIILESLELNEDAKLSPKLIKYSSKVAFIDYKNDLDSTIWSLREIKVAGKLQPHVVIVPTRKRPKIRR